MQSRGSGRVICGLWACAYGVVFALPYSQDAVFAHNQHTKFLAGLALAGYGDVAADWMACVADPFPSFSWLLKWQHRLLGVHLGAHLSFFALTGIYGTIALRLARACFPVAIRRPMMWWVFGWIWLVVHSVHMRSIWLDCFPTGLGGFYVLGSYYQPCCFGIFVLGGIAAYAEGRWMLAAVCVVVAAFFHPTYVLPSGVVAVGRALIPANRSLDIRWTTRLLFVGVVLAVILPYGLRIAGSFSASDSLVQRQAHQLLSEIRIPHHSLPLRWQLRSTTSFFVVGCVTAWLGRRYLVGQVLMALLLFVGATVLQAIVAYNPTVAAIAPWRLSVVLAPLCWALMLGMAAKWMMVCIDSAPPRLRRAFGGLAAMTVSVVCLLGVLSIMHAYEEKRQADYYRISRFLERYHAARRVYCARPDHLCAAISELKRQYSVTHVVVPRCTGDSRYAGIGECVYRDRFYSLWDLRGTSCEDQVVRGSSEPF